MNVQPVDLGDELRERVQFRLAFAPIVIGPPITREVLSRRELHALRCIGDVSRSGHFVALMRLRNFGKFRSGKFT